MDAEPYPFLRKIRAVIWDHDGVHISMTQRFLELFDAARRKIVPQILSGLTADDAHKIGKQSYRACGDGLRGFKDWAAQNGHDGDRVLTSLFNAFHGELYNSVALECPELIAADPALIDVFARCAGRLQHGVHTHASIGHWVRPCLKSRQILTFFAPEAMLGFDAVGYKTKTESVEGLLRIMDALGVTPEETIYAEDNLDNAKFAKMMLPDLRTAYIYANRPLDLRLPTPVDIQVSDPKTLMQHIARHQGL